MASPYAVGDRAASFVLDEQNVLVREVTVEAVTQVGDDRWTVVTNEGVHQVNNQGEGNDLVPIDAELRAEFDRHPDGWTVVETTRDLDIIPEQSMEQGRDGHGY